MTVLTPEPQPESAPPSLSPAFLFVIGAAIASAFVAIWGIQAIGHQRERALETRVDSLRTALSADDRTTARGRNLAKSPDADTREVREVIDASEIEELKQEGLADPVHDLKKDLEEHRELIPYPGVLGGTMGFYREDDIRILGRRWVFARFDDGHIGGSMLLEYRVVHGTIHWKALAAAKE